MFLDGFYSRKRQGNRPQEIVKTLVTVESFIWPKICPLSVAYSQKNTIILEVAPHALKMWTGWMDGWMDG